MCYSGNLYENFIEEKRGFKTHSKDRFNLVLSVSSHVSGCLP